MTSALRTILVIVALVVVAVAGYYFGYDHGFEKNARQNAQTQTEQNNSQVPTGNASEDAFHKDQNGNFYGTLTLTGFLETKTRVCNPGDMCGETVEYSSFVFTQTSSNAITEFVGEMQGNSYVALGAVGIGCLEEDQNRIYYENDADSGFITGTITGDDYAKLKASGPNNQIQLKLIREYYTGGRGAPDCYSHFRNFDVL